MNKMLKLPLFLGVTGACCAIVLSLVYSVTNPIIVRNEKAIANAAYISMYSAYGVTGEDIVDSDVSDELYAAGCTTKVVISKANGACYTCSVKGYDASGFKFQVAFADGKYIGYTDLGNNETSGYGATLIANVPSIIKGVDANTALTDYSTYTDAMANKSKTGKPLAAAIEACRQDYLANVYSK